ncbi:MAG: tyrosine-type recombinase/integrase [Armatimonadota bacterium]
MQEEAGRPTTRLRLVSADIGGPPNVQEVWSEFRDELRLRGLSSTTIAWYRSVILPFGRYIEAQYGPDGLYRATERDVRAFERRGSETAGPRRLNHYTSGLRRFYEWLQEEGYAQKNPAAGIPKIREPRRLIKTLNEGQLRALLQQPDRTRFVGLRDFIFILLLLDTGLRLSEALGLKVADVDTDLGVATVWGKGARERRVSLSPKLLAQLKRYLRAREAALSVVGRPNSPWVFINDVGGKWSARGAQRRLKRYARQAGIQGVRVSPHTLRHTFALAWVEAGGDVFTLQHILGHSGLEMTRRYVNVSDAHVLAQHRKLSPLETMDLPIRGARMPRKALTVDQEGRT